jgi:hypothetical protein
MLLAEFTTREGGLLMIAVSVLPALLFRATLARPDRKHVAKAPEQTPAENVPIVSVKVEGVAPLKFVRTTVPAIEKKVGTFATAQKLVLHRGQNIAFDAESPMPELKGTRSFVGHH